MEFIKTSVHVKFSQEVITLVSISSECCWRIALQPVCRRLVLLVVHQLVAEVAAVAAAVVVVYLPLVLVLRVVALAAVVLVDAMDVLLVVEEEH